MERWSGNLGPAIIGYDLPMDLKEIGEFGWIERIRKTLPIRNRRIVKAIGDDAAVFRCDGDFLHLLTTDLLVERVHFERATIGGADLGHKALAANLSDIAAMGGVPQDAFVSIGVPDDCRLEFLDALYDGMKQLAQQYDVNILGGDTTGSKIDLVINIALTGKVEEDRVLFRNTARPGDTIFCTGWLGESRAGLHLLAKGLPIDSEDLATLRNAHLRPRPQIEEGLFLAACPGVHAVIDVSDGLSSDLGHIARESRVGGRIFSDRIPVSPPLAEFCRRFDFDPLEMALAGGEDFVLLGTMAAASAEGVARRFRNAFGRPLHCIGEVTDGGILEWVDAAGDRRPLAATGWDHFAPEVP